jgi:hypothetical protein
MRAALQALALAPDDAEAQKILLSLVVEGSSKLPPAAEREFEEADIPSRIAAIRYGVLGTLMWLASVPFWALSGIRSWPPVLAGVALVVGTLVYLRSWLGAIERE